MDNLLVYLLGSLGIIIVAAVVAKCIYNGFDYTKSKKQIAAGVFLGLCCFVFNYFVCTANAKPVFDLKFMLIVVAGSLFDMQAMVAFIPLYLLSVWFSDFSILFAFFAAVVAIVLKIVKIPKKYVPAIYILTLTPIVFSEIPIKNYLSEYNAKALLTSSVGIAVFLAVVEMMICVYANQAFVTSFFIHSYIRDIMNFDDTIYPLKIDAAKTIVTLSDKCVKDMEFTTSRLSYDAFEAIIKNATDATLTPICKKLVRTLYVTPSTGQQRYYEYACSRRLFGGYKGLFRDITNDESRYGLILRASERDYVTELPSYSVIKEKLPEEMSKYTDGSVALIDISVNVSRSQKSVYELETELATYRYVAKLVKSTYPQAKLYSVHSGEMIMTVHIVQNEKNVKWYAENIHRLLSITHKVGDREVFVTAYVAAYAVECRRLLGNEDVTNAMEKLAFCKYMIENSANKGVYIFSALQYENFKIKNRRLRYLPSIIRDRKFKIVYQPIVKYSTGVTMLYEALLRVDNGIYDNTGDFVADAISEGYDVELDQKIICAILEDVKSGKVNTSMSLNVLANTPVFDEVLEIAKLLDENGHTLYLEFTEYMHFDAEKMHEKIRRARSNGIKIVSDDFGSGFSTNENMSMFDYDVLKIAKEIVSDIDTNNRKAEIVKSIAQFCNALNIECIAEGVERKEEADKLAGYSIDLFQGFYFSRECSTATQRTVDQLRTEDVQ